MQYQGVGLSCECVAVHCAVCTGCLLSNSWSPGHKASNIVVCALLVSGYDKLWLYSGPGPSPLSVVSVANNKIYYCNKRMEVLAAQDVSRNLICPLQSSIWLHGCGCGGSLAIGAAYVLLG